MRNIGITTFVTLLMLGTAIIGSGHVVLARNFSNSGNYLLNDQNCTAGNSCNLSSSNTVTSGSSGLTSPSPTPTPTPTPTTLTLIVGRALPSSDLRFSGALETDAGPVVGATITFTRLPSGGVHPTPIDTEGPVVTDINGKYQVTLSSDTSMMLPGMIITANYAGAPPVNALAASAASTEVPI
jgi:hypothetical protein